MSERAAQARTGDPPAPGARRLEGAHQVDADRAVIPAVTIEIPAGTRERGEPTLACAKRELEEETGFRAKRWKLLTRFLPAPGVPDDTPAGRIQVLLILPGTDLGEP